MADPTPPDCAFWSHQSVAEHRRSCPLGDQCPSVNETAPTGSDPTPAEIEAGAKALVLFVGERDWNRHAARDVLRAVLPDHDARVHARVAEEIAQAIEASDQDGTRTGWRTLHAAIARAYANPPTAEGDPNG